MHQSDKTASQCVVKYVKYFQFDHVTQKPCSGQHYNELAVKKLVDIFQLKHLQLSNCKNIKYVLPYKQSKYYASLQ